jgi:hypothetical protein
LSGYKKYLHYNVQESRVLFGIKEKIVSLSSSSSFGQIVGILEEYLEVNMTKLLGNTQQKQRHKYIANIK